MQETTYAKLCAYGRIMKLPSPEECLFSSETREYQTTDYDSRRTGDWFSDTGSTPVWSRMRVCSAFEILRKLRTSTEIWEKLKMDYKEAIEKHTNECRHRIDVIRNHMNTNGDYDKDVCNKNIDVPKIAISALNEIQAMHNNGIKRLMDELVEYKQLGTLEEVLDAVEKQKRKKPKNVNTEGYRYIQMSNLRWEFFRNRNSGLLLSLRSGDRLERGRMSNQPEITRIPPRSAK